MSNIASFDVEHIERQVARVLGAEQVRVIAAPAGGSRAAYRVDIDGRGHAAFLRLDDGESGMSDSPYDLRREAAILRHVRAAGLPVPAVLGEIDEPPGTILEYVEGTSRIDAGVADVVGPEYMGWIAATHRIDPAGVPVERFASLTDAVRSDLAWWSNRAVHGGRSNPPAATSRATPAATAPAAHPATPLMALAIRVLDETAPRHDGPPVFVHGDVGPGNFMVRDGRVAAVLDWELAHLGDFHEDLAWLWMRGAHSDFGDPQRRFAEYEAAAGCVIDRDRLRWHLAFVIFKTVVALRTRLQQPGGGRLVMTQYVLLTVYEALLASALAAVLGTRVDVLADPATTTAADDDDPPEDITPEVRVIERLAAAVDRDDREAQVAATHLRLAAAQRAWRTRSLLTDCRTALGLEPDELTVAIPSASAAELAAMAVVLGRDAGRACWSLPPALRRVRRAQAIGLGT